MTVTVGPPAGIAAFTPARFIVVVQAPDVQVGVAVTVEIPVAAILTIRPFSEQVPFTVNADLFARLT